MPHRVCNTFQTLLSQRSPLRDCAVRGTGRLVLAQSLKPTKLSNTPQSLRILPLLLGLLHQKHAPSTIPVTRVSNRYPPPPVHSQHKCDVDLGLMPVVTTMPSTAQYWLVLPSIGQYYRVLHSIVQYYLSWPPIHAPAFTARANFSLTASEIGSRPQNNLLQVFQVDIFEGNISIGF